VSSLLGILKGLGKVLLLLPALLGDGADVLGQQGLAQPMPNNLCPQLTAITNCDDPTKVDVSWAGGGEYRLEHTSCWGASGPDDCTSVVTRATFSPTQIAASPQDIIRIVGDCHSESVQVPFTGRSVQPEPSSGDDLPVTAPFEAPDDYP